MLPDQTRKAHNKFDGNSQIVYKIRMIKIYETYFDLLENF